MTEDDLFRWLAKEWQPTCYMPPKREWTEEEIYANLKSGRWRVEYTPRPKVQGFGILPQSDWTIFIQEI